jgi:hypothetical protein
LAVLLGLWLAGCAEAPTRAAATDPYQACLYRGNQIGNLPYSATTFYQSEALDRLWPAVRSPVAQCNELRERGEL